MRPTLVSADDAYNVFSLALTLTASRRSEQSCQYHDFIETSSGRRAVRKSQSRSMYWVFFGRTGAQAFYDSLYELFITEWKVEYLLRAIEPYYVRMRLRPKLPLSGRPILSGSI
jgi:hypothetical protein